MPVQTVLLLALILDDLVVKILTSVLPEGKGPRWEHADLCRASRRYLQDLQGYT